MKKKISKSLDIETFELEPEINDLINFFSDNMDNTSKKVTPERIDANFEEFGNAINTFLTYPDILADIMTPVDSHFSMFFAQRLLLRGMARHTESFHTWTRGFSKSFTAAYSRYIQTMLSPRHKSFLVAETKIQAAMIAKEKIQDLWVRFPLLANEMQKFRDDTGKITQPYVIGKEHGEFRFSHGGIFDVIGSGSSIRGARRNSGIFEEVIKHDAEATNERILPLLNKERESKQGVVNPLEPHSNKIFVTTAGFEGTFAYDKLTEVVARAVLTPDKAFVTGGSWKVPVLHGLLPMSTVRDNIASPSFSKESFDREYASRWSGTVEGAAFDIKKLERYRKIIRAERSIASRYQDDFYVISVDIAKDGDAKTAGVVLRVSPGEVNYVYKVVNAFQINSSDFQTVAREIKKAAILYDVRLLVYDANGVGAALRDWLNKPFDGLPAFGIINPPKDIKRDLIKNRRHQIVYEIKSSGEKGSTIHKSLFARVASGNVRFLISSKEALVKFKKIKKFTHAKKSKQLEMIMPYQHTDTLIDEMKNLELVDMRDSGNPNAIKLIRRNKTKQKDFFSALEYGVFATEEHIERPYYSGKRRRSRNMGGYIM